MHILDTRDVFTPTKPAILTFVEREYLNAQLVDALRTPGKQLVVYGHSGSGKTTLLLNKLRQTYELEITTRCMSGLTFEHLLLDAFDQLGPLYEAGRLQKRRGQISSGLSADYLGIKAQIGASTSDEAEVRQERMLPPQLTPQRLASFIGEAGACWVLEDFHKLADSEKIKLAQVMKIFMDMAVTFNELKVIAIGAVGTAREVVSYDQEMRNRVAEIHVPLMTSEEINSIIHMGEGLLNISFPSTVTTNIVKYSNGLASVCHQLALNSCYAAGVNETQNRTKELTQSGFEEVLKSYVSGESDSTKATFDRALRQQRKGKYDNCRLILKVLADSDAEDGLTPKVADILSAVRRTAPSYPQGNLTTYLEQLQSDALRREGQLSDSTRCPASTRLPTRSKRYSPGPCHNPFSRMASSPRGRPSIY